MTFQDNSFSYANMRLAKEDLTVKVLANIGLGVIGISCSWRPQAVLNRPYYSRLGVEQGYTSSLEITSYTHIKITDPNIQVGDVVSIQYFY